MDRSNQTNIVTEELKPKQYRKFQVYKSTPLGLVQPQNLRLTLRSIDKEGNDLGPEFETSNMMWLKAMGGLPPAFELFPARDETVTGITSTERTWPISKVKRIGWQSISSIKANIEMIKVNDWMRYEHDLPIDIRSNWYIKRVGLGRHYDLFCTNGGHSIQEAGVLKWKGSTKTLHLLDDNAPNCNGNLKLEDSSGNLLAVWKQRRDNKILGSITIFEAPYGVISLETILASCIFVVLAERINGVTLVGGMGKRARLP